MKAKWFPENGKIVHGDVLNVLKAWPDNFIQTVVTSPPYWNLRDYSATGQIGLESSSAKYIKRIVGVFAEVRRVLKKDGTLWMNLGDTYNSGPAGARNEERWPKQSRNGHRPTRSKGDNLKPKDMVGIPWRVALALQADGWYLRSDIIWSKPNPMPESVNDRPTKAHEYIFLLSKSQRYFYNAEAIKEPSITGDIRRPYGSQGAWDMDGRSKEQRNGGKNRKPSGWDDSKGNHKELFGRYPVTNGKWSKEDKQSSGHRIVENVARARAAGADHDNPFGQSRNKRSVWTIPTAPCREAHFATFPEDLIDPCIKAGSRPGDIVLDPFMGSGTTAIVAKRYKRNWIGIDINQKYIEMAERRIASEPEALIVE